MLVLRLLPPAAAGTDEGGDLTGNQKRRPPRGGGFSDARFFQHPGRYTEYARKTEGAPGRKEKGMERMGALIWFVFVAVITVVLERESFFP